MDNDIIRGKSKHEWRILNEKITACQDFVKKIMKEFQSWYQKYNTRKGQFIH